MNNISFIDELAIIATTIAIKDGSDTATQLVSLLTARQENMESIHRIESQFKETLSEDEKEDIRRKYMAMYTEGNILDTQIGVYAMSCGFSSNSQTFEKLKVLIECK